MPETLSYHVLSARSGACPKQVVAQSITLEITKQCLRLTFFFMACATSGNRAGVAGAIEDVCIDMFGAATIARMGFTFFCELGMLSAF